MKELIIKGADELFTKYGLRSVTMDDIAKRVGISKKTIYQLFEDKDALVEIIVKQKLEEQYLAMQEIAKTYTNPIEEVLKMSEYIRTAMTNLHPSVVYDMQKFFPKSYENYNAHIDCCFKESFSNNIEKGIAMGLYRPNINADILSKLRMVQIEIGFNPEIFPPTKYKLQDIQVEFIMHFLHGICTIKGHKMINKFCQINEE